METILELNKLYKVKPAVPSKRYNNIRPRLYINGGTVDVYDYGGLKNEADIELSDLHIETANQNKEGTEYFSVVPEYIYITQNTGTTTSIIARDIDIISAKRYLDQSDFPNSITLYGWRAGLSPNLTTINGGIDLDQTGSGFALGDDHTGANVYCACDGWDNHLSSANANLLIPSANSFSYMCLFKRNSVVVGQDTFLLTLSSNKFSFFIRDNYIAARGGSTQDLRVDGINTGSDWHSFVVTRDMINTETKIYIDGVEVGSVNAASSYTSPSYMYIPYLVGDNVTEVWLHKDTVWSANEIASLHEKVGV